MLLFEKLHRWDLRLPLTVGLFLVHAYSALTFYTSVYYPEMEGQIRSDISPPLMVAIVNHGLKFMVPLVLALNVQTLLHIITNPGLSRSFRVVWLFSFCCCNFPLYAYYFRHADSKDAES